ncbi:MAG: hypothetical protein LUD72_09950, partial [Bacteroidales bacterium]|nr:hypothetical protein [Bacteroidales bacterium]
MEERHSEETRSDYNRENRYSATHPDALSDGDTKGKGTHHGGHGAWLPDCSGTIGTINYSNFDTANGGNSDDVSARNTALARSLYSSENKYSSRSVSTDL